MDKKTVPFQRNQMQKIVDIMGLPTKDRWPYLVSMPEYQALSMKMVAKLARVGRCGHRVSPETISVLVLRLMLTSQ